MFRTPSNDAAVRRLIDEIERPFTDPSETAREAVYVRLAEAFGVQHPTGWPDPRGWVDRVFTINPLLRRMRRDGLQVPSSINATAFARDRAQGQGYEDAGGYAWRGWQAGLDWSIR